jgi:ATP-dependent RNA helicase DDX18/HAS1
LNNGNQPVLIADQTGSGKTLAYLLPLLQRALQKTPPSTTTTEESKKKEYGAPKVLILAPTAELADQTHAVCTKISKMVPFQTMVVTATGKYTTSIRDQIRRIQRQQVDVMISTPGRLSTILRTRNSGLDLTNLQSIVLDEVDILLIDQTFGPQLRTVSEAAPSLDKTQFVFVTATLPDSIVQKVQKEFPGVQQIRGPGLHRVAPSLKERLVDVSVPSESNRDAAMCFDVKAKQLLKALRQNRCRRTLIFCNTVESCRTVENLLNRKDRRAQVYDVGAYHNAMTPETRNANLQRFAAQGRNGNGDVDSVLICTDRAARGVDFDTAPVDHVVIFDFPKDPAEYVRRVGRTARAGRTGTSTVFAYGWQLPVARNVMLDFTLDSFTIAIKDNDNEIKDDNNGDDPNNSQYESRKLNRKGKKSKDAMIKENIERGRLWDETKY